MSTFFFKLRKSFINHPYITNAVVYGSLFCGAEFSQQVITRKIMSKETHALDTASIGRYAIYGTFIQSPILTAWYTWLDSKIIGKSYKIIIKKVLMDQFLMTPHLIWLFFVAMSIMEKKNAFMECREKFVHTFTTSCIFWLPAQSLNFAIIPTAFRVTYIGLCSLVWVNILCYLKRNNVIEYKLKKME